MASGAANINLILESADFHLSYKNKSVFILSHDSNPSVVEIQDVRLENGKLFYGYVTELVYKKWNKIREICDDEIIILSVGFGTQGGKIENIRYGINSKASNLILSASRNIIFCFSG